MRPWITTPTLAFHPAPGWAGLSSNHGGLSWPHLNSFLGVFFPAVGQRFCLCLLVCFTHRKTNKNMLPSINPSFTEPWNSVALEEARWKKKMEGEMRWDEEMAAVCLRVPSVRRSEIMIHTSVPLAQMKGKTEWGENPGKAWWRDGSKSLVLTNFTALL